MSDTARKLSVSMIVLYENSQDEKECIFGESTLIAKAQNQRPLNIDDPTSSEKGEKSSLMKNLDVLPPASEQQTRQPRTNGQSESLFHRKSKSKSQVRNTAKQASTSESVTSDWGERETMEVQFARRSTNQDQKKQPENFSRKTSKRSTAKGTVVAEQTKTEGTRYSVVRPQIAADHAPNTVMGKKREKKNSGRIAKQPTTYHDVSEEQIAISQMKVRNSSDKPHVLSQSTNQSQILVARRKTKQFVAHRNSGESREAEGARCTAVQPQIHTKREQRRTKEARLFQNGGPISQEQRRITQQPRASKMTKPPLPQKQNTESKRSDGGEPLIRRQVSRRPRVGQRITAVRVRDGYVDMVMVTDAPVVKEGTRAQYIRKSQAVVKRPGTFKNSQGTKEHQAANTQQTIARDERITVTAKDIGGLTRNQVKTGRRVAFQLANNDHVQHQYSARRDGLCNQTGPSQEELTFIRVLRKRF